jgi:hypothetical protein
MAFHAHSGLYFERRESGDVVVSKRVPVLDVAGRALNPPAFAVVEQWTLEDATWASVMASVSARGETGGTWQEAREFHNWTGD